MFRFQLSNDLNLKITPYADGIIQLSAFGFDGKTETILERYGFLNTLNPDIRAEFNDNTLFTDNGISLSFSSDGAWELFRNQKKLTSLLPGSSYASASTVFRNRGYCWDISLDSDEKLIGFGDQNRTSLLLNGQKDELHLLYPVKHIPVPFYMSSRGYGIFFNTTRRLRFDCGVSKKDVARFMIPKDFCDVYIIIGDSYDTIIEKYTRITGRPSLPPLKSFGLWHLMHTKASGHDVLFYAQMLRDKNIPCDNLSLEPGWMQEYYDPTTNKEWNSDRFRGCSHGCSYRAGGDWLCHSLKEMGYNLGLWLCSRWDFTYEEERRINKEKTVDKNNISLNDVELSHYDENVGHSPIYMDENTNRNEAWFEHLKKFVNDGVSFFKLDPAWLINEFPDRLYGNGKTDDEMHNIAFQIATKQMITDYENYTHRRGFGLSVAGWAGAQRFPGHWAGDTGGGKQSMVGLLQDAIVGCSFTTCDMDMKTASGIHMGFMSPWSMINNWSYFNYPGMMGREKDELVRFYAQLRMALLPYYYSLAYESTRTGKAILRPMCMEFPQFEESYELKQQFLVGRFILTDVFSDHNIWLPEGEWYDFWTGNIYEGNNATVQIPVQKNRGGHLLIRAGAVIPTWDVQNFVGEKEIKKISWLVFPGKQGVGSFTYYTDDGMSLDYREDKFAKVTLSYGNKKLSLSNIDGGEPYRIMNLEHTVNILGMGTELVKEIKSGEICLL
ncbi:MAG: Alpha-xylosidase [Chloroflexi bacterium ADurb.Bin344]|nr:MAG: Alpha-xylosidase [Chloroflexi bacterium ADurb.Bin344]